MLTKPNNRTQMCAHNTNNWNVCLFYFRTKWIALIEPIMLFALLAYSEMSERASKQEGVKTKYQRRNIGFYCAYIHISILIITACQAKNIQTDTAKCEANGMRYRILRGKVIDAWISYIFLIRYQCTGTHTYTHFTALHPCSHCVVKMPQIQCS